MADENNQQVETTPDDDFAKAFAEFGIEAPANEPAKKPEETPAPAAAPAAGDTPAGDQPVAGEGDGAKPPVGEAEGGGDGAAAGVDGALGEDGKPAVEAKPAEKPAEKPAAPADDAVSRLADTLAKRLEQQPQPQPKQPEQQRQEPPLYTKEEQAVLAKYAEEYPEIAAAEALRRRGEYSLVIKHTLNQVATIIAPYMQQQEELVAKLQYQTLQQEVEGYDDALVDAVTEWVKTQPDYLQDAYNRVIENGTDQQVKDLVDRYRAATGTQKPAAPAPAPAPKKETELPAQAKKAAAALAPVSSKRSAVVTPVSPDDFEGAFAEFAKSA